MQKKPKPTLQRSQLHALERINAHGSEFIIGIDEVGLGCLAGPVTVGAVVLPKSWHHKSVTDSKALTHRQRTRVLHEVIYPNALVRCALSRTAEDVDTYGIERCRLELTEAAALFCRARFPDALVVQDGDNPAMVDGSLRNVVFLPKADFLVASVSAASILAKVTRDMYMEEMHERFPKYDFIHNRGYRSQKHIDAIVKYGPCVLHRMSYRTLPELIAVRLNHE